MSIYLLFFFVAYLALTMALPRWRVMRLTGENAFVIPRDDSAQGFIGRIFRLLFLLVLLALVVNAFVPAWAAFLLPADFLKTQSLFWAGMFLLHGSLLLVIVAQVQMSRSWRVGFDEKKRTELVESGLFNYSRNPVFVGMLMTMAGLFLALPNAITLLVAVLTWVVLQIQVRMEEDYLSKAHGAVYAGYAKRVRRWL